MGSSEFLQSPEALLSTLQLTDSLFPSGRYTLSHGLETFVETGRIHDAESLELVVRDYLTESVGRCEAVMVARANEAAAAGDLDALVAMDNLLHALRLPWEVSTSSVRTGRHLIVTSQNLVHSDILERFAAEVEAGRAHGGHAVVFGIVSRAWGMDERTAVLGELYAYTAALLGSSLRLMRLSHADAQAIILRLQPNMIEAAEVALKTPYEDVQAFAPMLDIMQMQHERSRMRLFAS